MKKVLLLIMAVVLMFSAITLVACSNDEEFTITFEVDGEVYDTVLVKGTAEISLPANPEKNGYVFKGWFFDKEVLSDEVTKKSFLEESLLNNITVYAKWELDKYAITYNLNGGTNSETNPASYTIEDAVTLSNPTKANNGFLGWFSDENLTTAFTGVAKGTTGGVTVYAKWAVNHFTYTFFDENGTTVLKTATVAYGSDIVAPSAPTKADANGYSYSFNSWDKTVPSTITTNITFTASYTETAIEYSVTYILDDGENNVDNVNSYTIEDEDIMLFDPEKTGYIFIGWFTDADFNSPITEIAQGSLGNLDIYAKWEKFITLNADMMQIIDDIWGGFGVDLVDADHENFYNTCLDFDTTAAVLYRALTVEHMVVAIEFTPEVNRNEYLTILADSYTWINFMEDGFVFRYMPYSNIIYLDVYSIGNILSGDFVWNDSQSAYLSGDGTHLLRYLGIDEEYTVASTITSIADKAFNGCDTLVTVTIPNSVNTIGVGAFAYCFNLVSITLPEGITTIETEMFYFCFNLVSAAIPSSVTTINHFAFFDCNSLEITLVEGILYIYDYAFSYCTSIATINIPNTVVYIGEHAFSFCDNAEAAFIPNSVEYIGGSAFNNYYDLVLFVQATSKPENWDEYWTNIDDEDIFWGVNSLFEYEDMLYLVKNEGATLLAYSGNSANKVTVPSSINVNGNIINVIAIYKKAFIDNQSITEVDISNGIVSIGDEVFAWCKKLEKVTIPNSVLTIGDGVFYNMIIGYTVSDFLFSIFMQEEILYLCKRKFIYESNVHKNGKGKYECLDFENVEHKKLYVKMIEILKNYQLRDYYDNSGKILKYFSSCADYHCIEILESIEDAVKDAEKILKDAPILWIVSYLLHRLNGTSTYEKIKEENFNIEDHILINWESIKYHYEDNRDCCPKLADEIIEERKKKRQKALNILKEQYKIRFDYRDGEASLYFDEKQYKKFKENALILAKPHYVFEGDVLDLLKIDDIVNKKLLIILGSFDLDSTLPKILGLKEI